MRLISILLFAASLPVVGHTGPELAGLVDSQLPGLVATYKNLHLHPELSHFEVHTSAFLADEWRKAGYEVTERVGKYPDGSQAYGIVGILKNGPGATVLVRTDLDALPIEEQTGAVFHGITEPDNILTDESGRVNHEDREGHEAGKEKLHLTTYRRDVGWRCWSSSLTRS